MNTELRQDTNDFMMILARNIAESHHNVELFNILMGNRLTDIPLYCVMKGSINLEDAVDKIHTKLDSIIVSAKVFIKDSEPKHVNGLNILKRLTNRVFLEFAANEGTMESFITDIMYIINSSYFGIEENNVEEVQPIIDELLKFPWLFVLIMMENIIISE